LISGYRVRVPRKILEDISKNLKKWFTSLVVSEVGDERQNM